MLCLAGWAMMESFAPGPVRSDGIDCLPIIYPRRQASKRETCSRLRGCNQLTYPGSGQLQRAAGCILVFMQTGYTYQRLGEELTEITLESKI